MNHYLAVVAVAAATCALGGCVSVFEGTSQDIAVNSTPAGASCVFEREGRSIGAVNTPGTLTVRKSKYDITVKCDKPGYEQATFINHSGTSAAIAANIIVDIFLTAGISSIVDSANGADNKYDSVVNVMLNPVANGAATVQPSVTGASQPVASATPVTVTPAVANTVTSNPVAVTPTAATPAR